MKLKNMLLIGAAAALFTTGTARAEHQMNWNWGDRFHYDSEGKDLYSAQEFTFDIFGTYSKGKEKFNDTFDKTLRHGDFGGGIGVNYFITRNFGIGTDAFAGDNGGDFVDAVSASAILRLPIDVAHLAPYVFAGGGRQFDGPDSWNLHVGVGLEFRLSSYTGIFIDGRHVFHVSDKSSDYALIRSGLRFAF